MHSSEETLKPYPAEGLDFGSDLDELSISDPEIVPRVSSAKLGRGAVRHHTSGAHPDFADDPRLELETSDELYPHKIPLPPTAEQIAMTNKGANAARAAINRPPKDSPRTDAKPWSPSDVLDTIKPRHGRDAMERQSKDSQ